MNLTFCGRLQRYLCVLEDFTLRRVAAGLHFQIVPIRFRPLAGLAYLASIHSRDYQVQKGIEYCALEAIEGRAFCIRALCSFRMCNR